MIEIDREITQDFARAIDLEWLETNGLGGWAGTTLAGAHSRRDHSLLTAAAEPAADRTVLLSRLDETLHIGGESFELSCNQFPGAIAPRGFEHLTAFRKDLFPTFELEAGGVRLRKTVAAVDGESTTLVIYEVMDAPGPFVLSLRPFLAVRDRQALTTADPAISQETPFEGGILRLHPYPQAPEVFLQAPGSDFRPNPQWWYRFEYEADRRRGVEFQEDLWTPGIFGRELTVGGHLGVILSTQDPAGRDAFALLKKERARREKIVKALPVQDDFARTLALAADAFLVRRGSSRRAVIAGYPGAEERSRDTLIALPGLCLVTGRHEDARKILRACVRSLQQGLLPDRFPGAEETPEPTSADASLWLFVAAYKYLQASAQPAGDEAFARETLLPALRKVVHRLDKGTPLGLKTGEDALLPAGPEGNALWVNALSILADLEARLGDAEEARRLAQRSKRAQRSFLETFWDEETGSLTDPSGGEPGPAQIFALSLPFPLLPKAKGARLLAAIPEESYAPAGLLGPYLTALVRVHGAAGRKKGLAMIEALKPRLTEARLGFLPAGEAGAWSLAEVLRAYVEDLRSGEAAAMEKAEKPEEPEKRPVRKGRKSPARPRG